GGRTVENRGSFSAQGQIIFNEFSLNGMLSGLPRSGTFENSIGAVFNASQLSGVRATGGPSDQRPEYVFDNAGTFRKDTGLGFNETDISSFFKNTGLVDIQSGTLRLIGGSTSEGGRFTGAGTLKFGGSLTTHLLDAATTVSMANVEFQNGVTTLLGNYNVTGSTRLAGGSVNLLGPVTGVGTTLTLQSGNLNLGSNSVAVDVLNHNSGLEGSGTLTVRTPAAITFGDMRGPGTTILQNGGTISVSGLMLDGGRTLRNEGVLLWSAGIIDLNSNLGFSGNIMPGAGTIENIAGARFIAAGNFGGNQLQLLSSNWGAADNRAVGVFNNAGTLEKSGSGPSDGLFFSAVLNNTGV